MLIGMLHHRKNPEIVRKAYAFAATAKLEGVEILYFTPKMVNLEQRFINGFILQDGKWSKVQSPYPNVIYNAGNPVKLNKSKEIITELKKEIPIMTHSVGHKMRVYKRFKLEEGVDKYFILSKIIRSKASFSQFFNTYQKIVFKPVESHNEDSITLIESINNKYLIDTKSKQLIVNYNQLLEYVDERIEQQDYLALPYINCRTKEGNVYDICLSVQKNQNGEWVITTIYPRIEPKGSTLSNINNQEEVRNYIAPILKQEFSDENEYFNIRRNIEHFSKQLTNYMDGIQKKYLSEVKDEIGIDVNLCDMDKVLIYEVNWRPGHPPTVYLELNVVRNTIRYAIYLAKEYTNNKDNLVMNEMEDVK